MEYEVQAELVRRVAEGVDRRLRVIAEQRGETMGSLLGSVGMDRQTLWCLKNSSERRRDPRVSTLVRLARAVGVSTPEQFALLILETPASD